jgi:hypothetical protein
MFGFRLVLEIAFDLSWSEAICLSFQYERHDYVSWRAVGVL